MYASKDWDAKKFEADQYHSLMKIVESPRPEPNNGWGRRDMFTPKSYGTRMLSSVGVVTKHLPAIGYEPDPHWINTADIEANRKSGHKPQTAWKIIPPSFV